MPVVPQFVKSANYSGDDVRAMTVVLPPSAVCVLYSDGPKKELSAFPSTGCLACDMMTT